MNEYSFISDITENPIYRACQCQEETPLYVPTKCGELVNLRTHFLGNEKTLIVMIKSPDSLGNYSAR